MKSLLNKATISLRGSRWNFEPLWRDIVLDNQINALREIMTDKDLRQYAEDGFWDLIQAVIWHFQTNS